MEQAPWRTARSSPHQYILQKQHPVIWQAIVDRIITRGRWGTWLTFRQKYVVFDGRRYWRMGDQPENVVLNRADHHDGDIHWLEATCQRTPHSHNTKLLC